MNTKIWYKNWLWWVHLALFIIFLTFLSVGLYICVFKEFWYVHYIPGLNHYPPIQFGNFDALMSFFSVQVNIMTIVWLLFYLINFNKNKNGVSSTRFRTVIINLNIIVFVIFWMGIIYYVSVDPNELSKYSTWQKVCTVITHFIAPLSLFVLYFFSMGEDKYNYLDIYKKSEVYIVCTYSFLYMIYVYVRGIMYVNDGLAVWAWPYPFLNFQKLFIGNSVIGYMILLSLVFVIWIVANQLLLIFLNNLVYKFKANKNTIN